MVMGTFSNTNELVGTWGDSALELNLWQGVNCHPEARGQTIHNTNRPLGRWEPTSQSGRPAGLEAELTPRQRPAGTMRILMNAVLMCASHQVNFIILIQWNAKNLLVPDIYNYFCP